MEQSELTGAVTEKVHEVDFAYDFEVTVREVKRKNENDFAIVITIDSEVGKQCLALSYDQGRKRIENVAANLRGYLADKGEDFLEKLEDLAKDLGCRAIVSDITGDTPGAFRNRGYIYVDGRYMKDFNPRPYLN